MDFPSEDHIVSAHERIRDFVHRTPVMQSEYINTITGAQLYFKCENFQKVGAFKARGAMNALLQLSDSEKDAGVCTHSSGNHAQALARAAKMAKIPAYIVMPENAPKVKVNAVKGYGGNVVFCAPNLKAREATAQSIIEKHGASFIHPYDNMHVIEGQATVAKELLETHSDLEILLTPLGGGGLLSGTCLSASYFGKNVTVYGAEPLEADDGYRSLKAGHIIPSVNPTTICDGLLSSVGTRNFPIIQSHVKQILTVEEKAIVEAMKLIWERMKIIVEPSAAVSLAVVMVYPELFKNKKLGLVLSGGNIDFTKIPF